MNTNIYSHLETSGGQSSNPYLNVVHFLNTRADKKSVVAQDSCFPALASNTCCSITRPDTNLSGQMTFDHLTFGQMMLCLIFLVAFLVYFLVFPRLGNKPGGLLVFSFILSHFTTELLWLPHIPYGLYFLLIYNL